MTREHKEKPLAPKHCHPSLRSHDVAMFTQLHRGVEDGLFCSIHKKQIPRAKGARGMTVLEEVYVSEVISGIAVRPAVSDSAPRLVGSVAVELV